jgi:asparagine synthase (glutamine-hydrolysing)
MCGISGYLQIRPGDPPSQMTLERMTNCVRHRGPDGHGLWYNAERTVGLGHRRLAIQDLSPLGHQPMASSSSRYTVAFNGEVYNFKRLQTELVALGHTFRGHSDTEVMLAAFEQWGVVGALPHFTGMFALAVWDSAARELTLVRDRFGVKPLYYGVVGNTLYFASELAPFSEIQGFSRRLNRDVLGLYVRYGNIPAPHCIWSGVQKLPPASFLAFRVGQNDVGRAEKYWNLQQVVEEARGCSFRGSYNEASDEVDRLLRDAIQLRMISDVPLGVFLSGGIDSSLVAALMQAQSTQPVRSFTIGFRDRTYDESEYATAVARHLGTDHTTLFADEAQALSLIPRLPHIYDEPFADSSQIPTFLVCQMARQHVTVALSGDGGDESFGGYNRHVATPRLWDKIGSFPAAMRRGGADLIDWNGWENVAAQINRSLPARRQVAAPLEKLQKIAVLLRASSPADAHLRLSSFWQDPHLALRGAGKGPVHAQPAWPAGLSFAEFMMFADTVQYLHDDILVKVDRASMAVALEVREPLLDHRLVEFAWRLPLEFKIQGPSGKRVLRDILYRYVPRVLIDRPKSGFGVPIDRWLRGALRDWAESLLSAKRIDADGIFDGAVIRRMWFEHLSGRRNHHHRLWTILMFNAWTDKWARV